MPGVDLRCTGGTHGLGEQTLAKDNHLQRMSTILIAGGSGLIGLRLSQLLTERGYTVTHLSRSASRGGAYQVYRWDPAAGYIDPAAVTTADYIINLAGEGIADKPWTAARKASIISSRTQSAAVLMKACLETGARPRAYLAASAIGYYGHRGDEELPETAAAGSGFLSESCVAWEKATAELADGLQVRTFVLRIGLVLSVKGGALAKMIPPAKMLVSPWFGDGRQWYPWVHIDDLCRMFIAAVEDERYQGIFNGVAPRPVRNAELARQLPVALGRPAASFPAPAFGLRLAMGELADVVLNSTRCVPRHLQAVGFQFEFPDLLPALRDLITRDI